MFGISICITAFKASAFIKECLDSIKAQTWIQENSNYEIILGIDGCEETLNAVQQIMCEYDNLRVLMMDCNMGTYVTSNTIMSEAKYDYVMRFDSDDIMDPKMVECTMQLMEEKNLMRYHYKDFPYEIHKSKHPLAHGIICISKNIFVSYGGYMPWKCGADTELITRLTGIVTPVKSREILFYRRVSESSLSSAKDTGMNSELRKQYHKYIKECSLTMPIIEMIKNTFTEITPKMTYEKTSTCKNVSLPKPKKTYKRHVSIKK